MTLVTLRIVEPEGTRTFGWDAEGGSLTFGRSASAGLSIVSDTLSREHGRLEKIEDQIFATDLDSRNGLKINGQRIWQRTAVNVGDTISVGDVTITLAIADSPPPVETDAGSTEVEIEVETSANPRVESAAEPPAIDAAFLPAADPPKAGGVFLEDSRIVDGSASLMGDDLPGLRSYEQTIPDGDHAPIDTAPPMMQRKVISVGEGQLILGRDPACDQPLDSLQVSRRHAQVSRRGQRVEVRDLRSTNGTTVNGQTIRDAVTLSPGDRLGLGPFRFEFDGHQLTCAPPEVGVEVRFQGVTVKGKPRPLLEGVAVTFCPGQLVGLVGDQPAELAALTDLLTGRRRPNAGSVLLNGVDRVAHRRSFFGTTAELRGVPAMHDSLRVRDVLRSAARLRLSRDIPADELNRHLDQILHTVDLADALKRRIRKLTAAQRMRVGLAVQLLTDPPLVVVDTVTPLPDALQGEAWAGGAELDVGLLPTLRRLCERGTLVIWLTRNYESMAHCDQVVGLLDGQIIANGKPAAVKTQLKLETWDGIFGLRSRREDRSWRERYLASADGAERERDARREADRYSPVPPQRGGAGRPTLRQVRQQTSVLTMRRLRRMVAEPGRALVDLLLPAALGAGLAWLTQAISGSASQVMNHAGVAGAPVDLALPEQLGWSFSWLGVAAILLGLLTGQREWLTDRLVVRQERRLGINGVAYLLSTVITLGLLAVIQSAVLWGTWVATLGQDPRAALGGWAMIGLATAIGIGLGMVSAGLFTGLAGLRSVSRARRVAFVSVGISAVAALICFVQLVVDFLGLPGQWLSQWGVPIHPGMRANAAFTGAQELTGNGQVGYGRALLILLSQLGVVVTIGTVMLLIGGSRGERRSAGPPRELKHPPDSAG